MRPFRPLLFLVVLGLMAVSIRTASAQDRPLSVKEIIPYNARAQAVQVTAAQPDEVRTLLARTSRGEGSLYSTNGQIEARLPSATEYDPEGDTFSASFFDSEGQLLGQFDDLSGQVLIPNDGAHFLTFDQFTGVLSFYSFERGSLTATHQIEKVRSVVISESGTTVLAASIQGRNVLLSGFDISGGVRWTREIAYLSLSGGGLALSPDGRRVAMSAYVLNPANDAIRAEHERVLAERKQRIDEARRAWAAENSRRRREGLPRLPWKLPEDLPERPQYENTKAYAWGQTPAGRSTLMLLNQNGQELARTDLHHLPYRNLTFAGAGRLFLAASRGQEVHLFDGTTGATRAVESLAQNSFQDTAVEVNRLDLNARGEVAVAAVVHPSKRNGRFIDRGLEDLRAVVLFGTDLAARSQYTFSEDLQIPLGKFAVKLGADGGTVLARAADSIFILGR